MLGAGRTVAGMADSSSVSPVLARDLTVGDEITELDTPGGPWLRVLRVDRERGVLLIDDAALDPVELAVDDWDATVLRRDG